MLVQLGEADHQCQGTIPPECLHHVPATGFKLDTDKLSRNLRSSRRGAAGGPSGMTMEHLRPLLHEARGLELFSELCSRLAQVKVPAPVIDSARDGSQHSPNQTEV